jgi:hypothetical protein
MGSPGPPGRGRHRSAWPARSTKVNPWQCEVLLGEQREGKSVRTGVALAFLLMGGFTLFPWNLGS